MTQTDSNKRLRTTDWESLQLSTKKYRVRWFEGMLSIQVFFNDGWDPVRDPIELGFVVSAYDQQLSVSKHRAASTPVSDRQAIKMREAIEGALRIESLWMPPDDQNDPEHDDEFAALATMRQTLKAAVTTEADFRLEDALKLRDWLGVKCRITQVDWDRMDEITRRVFVCDMLTVTRLPVDFT